MDETTVRNRQKQTTDQNSNENEKMFVKNRKPSTDSFLFVDEQKLPTNIRDIFAKQFLRMFLWEFYFGKIFHPRSINH